MSLDPRLSSSSSSWASSSNGPHERETPRTLAPSPRGTSRPDTLHRMVDSEESPAERASAPDAAPGFDFSAFAEKVQEAVENIFGCICEGAGIVAHFFKNLFGKVVGSPEATRDQPISDTMIVNIKAFIQDYLDNGVFKRTDQCILLAITRVDGSIINYEHRLVEKDTDQLQDYKNKTARDIEDAVRRIKPRNYNNLSVSLIGITYEGHSNSGNFAGDCSIHQMDVHEGAAVKNHEHSDRLSPQALKEFIKQKFNGNYSGNHEDRQKCENFMRALDADFARLDRRR
jgi:hypothetical protein